MTLNLGDRLDVERTSALWKADLHAIRCYCFTLNLNSSFGLDWLEELMSDLMTRSHNELDAR